MAAPKAAHRIAANDEAPILHRIISTGAERSIFERATP
jgi:hypothetical protein